MRFHSAYQWLCGGVAAVCLHLLFAKAGEHQRKMPSKTPEVRFCQGQTEACVQYLPRHGSGTGVVCTHSDCGTSALQSCKDNLPSSCSLSERISPCTCTKPVHGSQAQAVQSQKTEIYHSQSPPSSSIEIEEKLPGTSADQDDAPLLDFTTKFAGLRLPALVPATVVVRSR